MLEFNVHSEEFTIALSIQYVGWLLFITRSEHSRTRPMSKPKNTKANDLHTCH